MLRAITILSCLFCAAVLSGQNNQDVFNSTRNKVEGGNKSTFNQVRMNDLNKYRQKLNAEYVSKTREKWKGFNSYRGLVLPDRDVKPITPIRISDEDAFRNKQDRCLDIEKVVTPIQNDNSPQPIAPIQEVSEDNPQYLTFAYLGTSLQVRRPQAGGFRLSGTGEDAVADVWSKLCDAQYNNMIVDCLKLRSRLKLCDWAYLMMLKALGCSYCGANTNESTLLTAYIFCQSGYKMRLGRAGGRLEILYASKHNVYDTPYFVCDGEKFFTLSSNVGSIEINPAKYPKEQSLSLWVNDTPQISYSATPARTLNSERYPEMSVHSCVNKNLLDFFDSYPTSEVGGNFMTRWAMYANSSVSQDVEDELYPQLRTFIAGKTQLEAVERLLNWVQTAFVYEYDDKVWGQDRAFFPEESLYYPYCDCEDRSILFTRLVRDLIGLKCVLVYYPGHLASAVCFTESVNGDYITLNSSRYIICDPTYIGAPVGMTMRDMDNSKANVILLD